MLYTTIREDFFETTPQTNYWGSKLCKTHNIARYRGLARGEGEPSVHPHLVPIFSIEIVKIVGTYGVPNPSPPPSFGQNFHIKYTVEVRR